MHRKIQIVRILITVTRPGSIIGPVHCRSRHSSAKIATCALEAKLVPPCALAASSPSALKKSWYDITMDDDGHTCPLNIWVMLGKLDEPRSASAMLDKHSSMAPSWARIFVLESFLDIVAHERH